MALLPVFLLVILALWHIISFNHYSAGLPGAQHALLLLTVLVLSFLALPLWEAKSPGAMQIIGLLDMMRGTLIGISCILIGGIHFIGVLGQEPVYVQMGYVILIIGYYETSRMAIDFREHYSRGMVEVTHGTLQRLLAGLAGRLGMVFALSVIMLYLSLMVIVGFTGPFSVAFLAAMMILAVALMTVVRRL